MHGSTKLKFRNIYFVSRRGHLKSVTVIDWICDNNHGVTEGTRGQFPDQMNHCEVLKNHSALWIEELLLLDANKWKTEISVIMWTGSRGFARFTEPLDTFRKAGIQNDQENSRPTAYIWAEICDRMSRYGGRHPCFLFRRSRVQIRPQRRNVPRLYQFFPVSIGKKLDTCSRHPQEHLCTKCLIHSSITQLKDFNYFFFWFEQIV
jgi:hypothetical protein